MRTEMIRSYIHQLLPSLGIRPNIPQDELRALHARRDFIGMVRHIRTSMHLTLRLRVGLVNSGGPKKAPAWIEMPPSLPLYGTSEFRRTRVVLFVRKEFLAESPFESVALGIAHELSHIVLLAIRHPLMLQEEAVDLTAMMLGYRNLYRAGCSYKEKTSSRYRIGVQRSFPLPKLILERKMTIYTHRFGYMSVDEVHLAADMLDRLAR